MTRGALGLVFVLCIILSFISPNVMAGSNLGLPQRPTYQIQFSPTQEPGWVEIGRGRDYLTYRNSATGEYKQVIYSGPIHTWDGSKWVSYVFENRDDHCQVQHPIASARFYPDRTEFWDENFSKRVVASESWSVERLENGNWSEIYLTPVMISYNAVSEEGVQLVRTASSPLGTLRTTYVWLRGSPVKITSEFTPCEDMTARFAWRSSGISASGQRVGRARLIDLNPMKYLGASEAMRAMGEVEKDVSVSFLDDFGEPVVNFAWWEEAENENLLIEVEPTAGELLVRFGDFELGPSQTAVLDPTTINPSLDGDITYNFYTGEYWPQTGYSWALAGELDVEREDPHYWQRAYFRFNISSLGGLSIDSASLKIYNYSVYHRGGGEGNCLLHHIYDIGGDLTYSDDWAKGIKRDLGVFVARGEGLGWKTKDVKNSVVDEVGAGSTYMSFRLKGSVEDANLISTYWSFRTMESSENKPYLEVTYVEPAFGRGPTSNPLPYPYFLYSDEAEKERFEYGFPNLVWGEWWITADDFTNRYNCYAWSVGINSCWIDYPDPNSLVDQLYGDADGNSEVSDFDQFYAYFGYTALPSLDLDQASIILYADASGKPQHGARRHGSKRGSGNLFESKCGGWERIIHEPDQLEDDVYGNIVRCYDSTLIGAPWWPGSPTTYVGAQSATGGIRQITVFWNKAFDADDGYNVKYSIYIDSRPPETHVVRLYQAGLNVHLDFNVAEKIANVTPQNASAEGYDYKYTITGLASDTTYYVGVRADDQAGNEETNRVEVSAKTLIGPTLTSQIISAPSEVRQGQTFTVTWIVTNNSPDLSASNVSVQSYVFLDSTCYNRCGWDSNLTHINLGPGETRELQQNIRIRTDLPPSDQTQLGVRARYAGVNYDDTQPIRVLPSSLVSRFVEAPDKVSLGETFTVRWRVTNDYTCRVENVRVHSYVYLYEYPIDETICYNVGGWGANEQYIDLEPGENRELVQTITVRSDVEPSTETRLRVRAVVPPQKVNENLENGEPIYESVAFYDTMSINVVPAPSSGVVWIFPSDDTELYESDPDTPGSEIRVDRVGVRSWDASAGDMENYRNIRSLLKFDLSEIPEGVTILDAELYLYCYYAGYTITGVTDVQVWSTRDDWAEDTVTWDNQPWQGGEILDTWVPPEYVVKYGWPKVWASWTVTDFVDNELEADKDKMASFCLRAAMESYNSQWRAVYFYSKDYTYGGTKIGGYDPHLVVTYAIL